MSGHHRNIYTSIVECYIVVAFSFFKLLLEKGSALNRFCSFCESLFLLVAFSFPNSSQKNSDL